YAEAFADAARRLRGVEIPADAWDPERLPPHLRMTFRVHGERGAVLGEGKDLVELQRRLARHSGEAVQQAVRAAVRRAGKGSGRAGAQTAAAPQDGRPLTGDWVRSEERRVGKTWRLE